MVKKILSAVIIIIVVAVLLIVGLKIVVLSAFGADPYKNVDFSMYDHEWIIGKTETEVIEKYGAFDLVYQYESSSEYISYYYSKDIYSQSLMFGITFDDNGISIECAKYYTEWTVIPYEILS